MRNYEMEILGYLNMEKRKVLDIRPLLKEFAETEEVPLRILSVIIDEMKDKGLISVVNYSADLTSKRGPIKAKIELPGIEKYNGFLNKN